VTAVADPRFIKSEERIAVFDNDGTLWSEMPFYFQFAFVLGRLKALAPQHPEWKDNPLYVLEGDMKTDALGGERAVLELATITHSGMTTDEFSEIVENWIATVSVVLCSRSNGTDSPEDRGLAGLEGSDVIFSGGLVILPVDLLGRGDALCHGVQTAVLPCCPMFPVMVRGSRMR
jgi:hypothetical protein